MRSTVKTRMANVPKPFSSCPPSKRLLRTTDRDRASDGFVRQYHWFLVMLIAATSLAAEGRKLWQEGFGFVCARQRALAISLAPPIGPAMPRHCSAAASWQSLLGEGRVGSCRSDCGRWWSDRHSLHLRIPDSHEREAFNFIAQECTPRPRAGSWGHNPTGCRRYQDVRSVAAQWRYRRSPGHLGHIHARSAILIRKHLDRERR